MAGWTFRRDEDGDTITLGSTLPDEADTARAVEQTALRANLLAVVARLDDARLSTILHLCQPLSRRPGIGHSRLSPVAYAWRTALACPVRLPETLVYSSHAHIGADC